MNQYLVTERITRDEKFYLTLLLLILINIRICINVAVYSSPISPLANTFPGVCSINTITLICINSTAEELVSIIAMAGLAKARRV